METYSPRIRSLLRQADRVADGGKRAAAEQLYRQIIEEAPETAEAWAGLGNVLSKHSAKEDAYNRALAIDPNNELAAKGMDQLHSEELESSGLGEKSEYEFTSVKTSNPGDDAATLEPDMHVEKKDYVLSPVTTDQNSSYVQSGHDHSQGDVSIGSKVLYCANHPNRETHLRCNKCGKPICSSCAQPTPVGYRCPECIREHEDIFYTAKPLDYVVAVLVALPLSLIGGILAPRLGFFVIFLGAIFGSLIGRIVFRAVGRRRGRGLPQLVSGIVVAGALLPVFLILLAGGLNLNLIRLIWPIIYMVTASGAAYYQMR
jgi:hypothetical protein